MAGESQLIKLGEKTQAYEVGDPCVIQLSPSDVAAALGMVKGELQRQLLCLIWYPQGFNVNKASKILVSHLLTIWNDQQLGLQALKLEQHIAATENNQINALDAEIKMDAYKRKCWPQPGNDKYYKVANAAFTEFSKSDLCLVCNGQGQKVASGKIITCPRCKGIGRDYKHHSDRGRAKAMRIDHKTYRERWTGIYAHSIDVIKAIYRNSADQCRHVLGSSEIAGL